MQLGWALGEGLCFLKSFDENSEMMGLSENEKIKVFWWK